MILKEYPIQELPREKAILNGIETLSNVELVALLLRVGNKQESVLELSQRLLNELGGIQYLNTVDYHQLVQVKGIKKAKAISILASVELAKRLTTVHGESIIIKTPHDIYKYIYGHCMFEKQEKVYLLCFNTKLELMRCKLLFVGSIDTSLFSTLEIFKEAFLCGSQRIVIVHNHPSGNPQPSREDKEVTSQIKNMSEQLMIELIDHIIIGNKCFYSFSANKVMSDD